MESRICLIRHGITEGNKNKLYYGFADIPLAEEGIYQLKELAAAGIYPEGGFLHQRAEADGTDAGTDIWPEEA